MEQTLLDYTLQQLEALLSIPSPTGYTREASDYVQGELERLGYAPQRTAKGGVVISLPGRDTQNARMLCCHLDTLGGMVAEVKDTGALRITPLGGLSTHSIEGENVAVITRSGGRLSGTFQLQNASMHVNPEYETAKRDYDSMEVLLDEVVSSAADTRALGVESGDIVCFDPRFALTGSGYIKSRFLDDKLSCAILLALAKQAAGAVAEQTVYLHFTVYEEVGHGAAANVPPEVREMLSVDMGCVGKGLACTEQMVSICAKDSSGPSSYELVGDLIEAAKSAGAAYAVDVYPRYGSDADCAVRAGHDLRHGVMGPGVYASHGYERSHVDGVRGTFDVLWAYLGMGEKDRS